MTAEMVEGKRVYLTPEGKKYPSVTTVISSNPKKAKAIARWRKNVGEEKANNITKRSTTRGTHFHSIVEDYFNNKLDLNDYKEYPLPVVMFKNSRDSLNKINNILLQEAALYSDHLELAGRVDCIAEYNGVLSIIDFKTSAKEKKEQYLYDYFVQETAYACMLLERYKLRVKQLVTIVSCEDGETQVVIRPLKKEYLASLFKYIDEYKNKHGKK
tara:strand:- start:655 stop:1296 length:642 start_codon:yes stop_codon:yes gene_type:complete